MNIGFIGLGQMGRGMALRLLQAGHTLTVFNRTRSAADPHVALGAKVAASPIDLLGAEIVISMLSDDAAVQSLCIDSGLAAHMRAGTIHLNMATTSLAVARTLGEIHAKGKSYYLSAPVFGRPHVAEQGQLDIIAAGPAAALARCKPLFDVMGKQTFIVGESPEHANVIKIARNFLLGTIIESLSEATALVRKAGVEAAPFINILTSTSLSAPAYKNYGRMIVERAFEPAQFKLDLAQKDVGLALSTAAALGMTLPIGDLMLDQIKKGIAAGHGEKDWVGLADYIADQAGLQPSSSKQ